LEHCYIEKAIDERFAFGYSYLLSLCGQTLEEGGESSSNKRSSVNKQNEQLSSPARRREATHEVAHPPLDPLKYLSEFPFESALKLPPSANNNVLSRASPE
jgi:hypothetical protein